MVILEVYNEREGSMVHLNEHVLGKERSRPIVLKQGNSPISRDIRQAGEIFGCQKLGVSTI